MAGITREERRRRDALYTLGLKQCNKTGEPLPLDAFAPKHDGYQGLAGTCRKCCNEATLEHQKLHPERVAERVSRWRKGNRDQWLAISRRRDVRLRWRKEGVVSV